MTAIAMRRLRARKEWRNELESSVTAANQRINLYFCPLAISTPVSTSLWGCVLDAERHSRSDWQVSSLCR